MNYVTKEGMEKMINELHKLKYTDRKVATDRLNAARKHGDLRENGDYKAARELIAQIDQKIGNLEMTIADSQIIEKDENSDVVKILCTVKIKDHTRNREMEYTLVSQNEADPLEDKLSVESPIGKGLLGKKVGDRTIINVPAGTLEFEILEIS